MANLFKVTYQAFTTDNTSVSNLYTQLIAPTPDDLPAQELVKAWQLFDTELMSEAKCTIVFQRLRAYAAATNQQVVRLVRMWESNVPEPIFVDVSSTHLPAP